MSDMKDRRLEGAHRNGYSLTTILAFRGSGYYGVFGHGRVQLCKQIQSDGDGKKAEQLHNE